MVDMRGTREGFADAIVELGEKRDDVYVLDADLAKSTLTCKFGDKYPERFIDCGIAEQNMLGVAAGLALQGKLPIATTYGVFISGRAFDQIRTTIAYSNLPVIIGGAHGGISVGADGATHQALEEISLMRVLPNMKLICPCDAVETKKAFMTAAKNMDGPVYIRFGREPVPVITDEETPFIIGKANTYKEGKDVTILSCGPMLHESLKAAEKLEKDGIDAGVINIHTVKPLDTEAIIKAAEKTGAIVTAEEHQVNGGFGSAVAETLAESCPVPMERVGVFDRFGESGEPHELLKAYGMTRDDIYEKTKKVVARKK